MTLAITPPVSKLESAALHDAIVGAGVPLDSRPPLYDSAWRRVASDEAVDNERAQTASYARFPRSTLGATSA